MREKRIGERVSSLEKEVKSLREKLAILARADEIAMSCSDLEPIFEKFVDLYMDVTDSEAGSLLLLDSSGGELEFMVCKGGKSQILRGTRLKVGEGIAGWVAKTGIPLIVNQVKKEQKWADYVAKRIGYETGNILCVPLKVRENVLGVVEVINKRRNKDFSQDDQEITELLSAHLVPVLENARLYAEMREKVSRLSTLIETSALISSTLDLSRVLELVMNAAKDVVHAEASSIFRLD